MKQGIGISLVGVMLALSGCGSITDTSDGEKGAVQVEPGIKQLKSLKEKHLPNYTLRAEDRGGTWPIYVLVAPDGSVVKCWNSMQGMEDLKLTDPKRKNYMGSPIMNSLFRKLKTKAASADEALQITKLIVGLAGGYGYLSEEWKFSTPVTRDGFWLIKAPQYVGPPASIITRGSYELHVDSKGAFVELRERFAILRFLESRLIDVHRPIDYTKHDPIQVLDILAKSNLDFVSVTNAPENWIRREHIPELIKRIDSKQPCAGVHSSRDSMAIGIGGYGPKKKGKSTIGHEAAFMIESYRHRLYPKSSAFSIDWTIDKDEIKIWWKTPQTRR